MFSPRRCPYRHCIQHTDPEPNFFRRHGSYIANCRPRPIPRFRCRSCKRTFSRQTFRADYRDHRPDLNQRLFKLLISGVGLRQSSRMLGLSRRCTELKFRKIARHLRRLNLNFQPALPAGSVLQFDEFESFETRRTARPVSIPMLIEPTARFVIWAESAPIRPHGRMTKRRLRAIHEDEERFGPRRSLASRAILRTLRRGAALLPAGAAVTLQTDEKLTYPWQAKRAFSGFRICHETTSGSLARMTWNPLFAINHTEAMLRDLLGRVRRQSWLVSKKRRYLDLGLQLWIAYRNLVRRRFNFDQKSPAELLGVVERRLAVGEILSWRQDWGRGSIHPLSRGCVSLEEWRARPAV